MNELFLFDGVVYYVVFIMLDDIYIFFYRKIILICVFVFVFGIIGEYGYAPKRIFFDEFSILYI